jgi:hypothetical protein
MPFAFFHLKGMEKLKNLEFPRLEALKRGLLVRGEILEGTLGAADYAFWMFEIILVERDHDLRPLVDESGNELSHDEKLLLLQSAHRYIHYLKERGSLEKRIKTNLAYLANRVDAFAHFKKGSSQYETAQREEWLNLFKNYLDATKSQDWPFYFKTLDAIKDFQLDPEGFPLSSLFF